MNSDLASAPASAPAHTLPATLKKYRLLLLAAALLIVLAAVGATSVRAVYATPEMDSQLVALTVNGASYTSGSTAPVTLVTDQEFPISITMQNTGTATWVSNRSDGDHGATFLSRGPDYNTTYGSFFIYPGRGQMAAPGDQSQYNTILRAPSTPGTYTMTWQMADWIIADYQWQGNDYQNSPFFGATITVTLDVKASAEQPPAAHTPAPGELNISDFEYAGSFTLPDVPGVPQGDEKAFFNSGITLRTVNGEKRLIMATGTYSQTAYEVAIPELGKFDGSDGSQVPQAQLRTVFGPLPIDPYAESEGRTDYGDVATMNGTMYYDQASGLLYWTNYHHYLNGAITWPTLLAADLSSGSLNVVGAWYQPDDLSGAPTKSFWGGVTGIPAGFAAQYTGGRTLALGFGGNYSINASASLGPALAAVSVGDGRDSMSLEPMVFSTINNRAVREGNYIALYMYDNFPQSPWLGTWTLADKVWSGVFIDLPDVQGYVSFTRQATGLVGYDSAGQYYNSTAQNTWYFYDLDTLGKAAEGEVAAADVQPTSFANIDLPYDPTSASQYIAGSCFDPDTRMLYLYCMNAYRTNANDMYYRPVVHAYYVKEPVPAEPEPATLAGIDVTTLPTQLSYTQGDTLDLTGMQVTATYSDGSTADVTADVTTSPAAGTTLGQLGAEAVTVSYAEDGVTQQATFNVEVSPALAPDWAILVTGVTSGNKQADLNFSIKSANGKGYTVYLSATGASGPFAPYADVNYNASGAHLKGLTNGVLYYAYVQYSDGSRSAAVCFTPQGPK